MSLLTLFRSTQNLTKISGFKAISPGKMDQVWIREQLTLQIAKIASLLSLLHREYHVWSLVHLFQSKCLSRDIIVTESAPTSTMTHTVQTTSTYLVQCTNSEIHNNDNMCGGGDGSFPIFSYEAPTTPGGTFGGYKYNMINSNNNNYSVLQIYLARCSFRNS